MSRPKKKRKPRAKKSPSSPVLIPTVITTDNGTTHFSSTSSNDQPGFTFEPVAAEAKKKVSASTKFVGGIIHAIPDGMLLKVGSLIFGKLIGKIPEDKREQFWEGLQDYSVKLAGAVTEGAARGVASEVKNNYSR